MSGGNCSECGGEVIGPVTVETAASGSSGELHVSVRQTSGMIRTPTRSQVTAELCTSCGRVELRADPNAIAERWRQGER